MAAYKAVAENEHGTTGLQSDAHPLCHCDIVIYNPMVYLKEKRSLGNKEEELEEERLSELKEKLENAKRQRGEMKNNLKKTIQKYFPESEIPGFTGVYSLLKNLTKRLLDGERDAYVEVQNTWPYYLATLEANGIIEYHPTDRSKVRVVDFSDGRLGQTD
ncbi:hypothetical protein DAPPUDRAFT_330421 [Daphnia pulex]|uniref:Uncharacterized protein n=1 Tax=Daphnia pulex TaxID=6669 RepID=E9HJI7_DAPPU|nr:hypothetical protein DAPPUDRAFT_330421 [Daphnia pulex]|eukprot:EFX68125.1 hypothetical protein DAPPUDRAFT_330421 [Daphnia pulex]